MNQKIIKIFGFSISILMIVISIFCLFDNKKIEADTIEKKESTYETLYVDIKGAVNNPGVYEMNEGSRVIDVIEEAGGLRDDADTSIINLSKQVEDEMYIIIYTKDEIMSFKERIIPSKKIVTEIEEKIICPDTDNDACIGKNDGKNSSLNSKVNINTASKEELMLIPGIGESKANSIIEYRENNNFTDISEIMNVSGIGESIYDKIKDYIEV